MFPLLRHMLLVSCYLQFYLHGTTASRGVRKATSTEYDVIVVGGGPGGIVSATKFAEAGLKTLLLERGGPMFYADGNREIPEWSLSAYPGNNLTMHDAMAYYTWGYPANMASSSKYYCPDTPELTCCMLGGGSTVNAQQYFWPPKSYLTNTFGSVSGWSSSDFQTALKRVVARCPPHTTWSSDNKYYVDGVYAVMKQFWPTIGVTEVDTLTDVEAKYNNTGHDVFSSSDGLRGGPVVGYLQHAKTLPSFTLKMHSNVTSLVRNGSTITGVNVNGTIITASTVVLSAGVWHSVALMFASGIGPTSELTTALSIGYTSSPKSDWIVNEAVGANLHDNPSTSVTITYNDTAAVPFYNFSSLYDGKYVKADADALFSQHTGPLTQFGRDTCSWIKIPRASGKGYMVVQFICSVPTAKNGTFACQSNLNEGTLSRGRISLLATGNLGYASGHGPWMTDSGREDVRAFAAGVKHFVDGINNYPGFNVTTPAKNYTTQADFEKFVGNTGNKTNNHWGGSCSVGTSDGSQGGTNCADSNAKVYGTKNLYVIDGSLSNAPTTSNPMMLYMGIAELVSAKLIQIIP